MTSNVKVTLDVAAKRVQSRLNKKSIKKDLTEIRDFLNTLNLEEFSKDDMDAAFNHFLTNSPAELSLLTSEEEIKKAVYDLINIPDEIEERDKGELIKTTAQELGITLTPEEVYLVAQEINTSSDDLTTALDEIKSTIINFINYKTQSNSQKIAEAMEEITQVATEGLDRNFQELKSGLSGVNSLLKGRATDFKRLSQAFRISA